MMEIVKIHYINMYSPRACLIHNPIHYANSANNVCILSILLISILATKICKIFKNSKLGTIIAP